MESLEPRGQLLRDAFLVSSPCRKTSQARGSNRSKVREEARRRPGNK